MPTLFLLLACALGFAGCESVAEATSAVRERMAGRDETKARSFAAQPRVTYDAVRSVAADMGYRFVRGGPAQGEFEALAIVPGGAELVLFEVVTEAETGGGGGGEVEEEAVVFSLWKRVDAALKRHHFAGCR